MPDALKKKPRDDNERRYALLALRVMGEFGAIIAVPVVVFALAGRWLDQRYGTQPLFIIVGFALAAALTSFAIVKKARAFEREYRALNKKEGNTV